MKKIILRRSKKNYSIKNRVIVVTLLIFLTSILFLKVFNSKIKYVLIAYAEEEIKLSINETINSTIEKFVIIRKYDQEELIEIVKDNKEEITSIDLQSIEINNIYNNISNSIIKELKNLEKNMFLKKDKTYYIPFGMITGLATSNWFGPKVPVKVLNIGSAETKINTYLKSYGINNALLELKIDIKVKVRILLPYTSKEITISREIPIIQKVIQGKIPQIYGGLYSNSSFINGE